MIQIYSYLSLLSLCNILGFFQHNIDMLLGHSILQGHYISSVTESGNEEYENGIR